MNDIGLSIQKTPSGSYIQKRRKSQVKNQYIPSERHHPIDKIAYAY